MTGIISDPYARSLERLYSHVTGKKEKDIRRSFEKSTHSVYWAYLRTLLTRHYKTN